MPYLELTIHQIEIISDLPVPPGTAVLGSGSVRYEKSEMEQTLKPAIIQPAPDGNVHPCQALFTPSVILP